MREDIRVILTCIDENNKEILRLRDWVSHLDSSQPEFLNEALDYLSSLILQISANSHDFLGYYYLFLGCILYEKGEYKNVIEYLSKVYFHLWESPINKSLVFWLLGLCHLRLHNPPEAREKLQSASDLLSQNTRGVGKYQYEQESKNKPIKEQIDKLIKNSQNDDTYLFSDIIYWLEVPQDKIWHEWQDAIYNMNTDAPYLRVDEQIQRLTRFVDAQEPNQFVGIGCTYLFLAECYRLENLSKKQQAITQVSKNALAAVECFRVHKFNQAIACWYIAALYYKTGNTAESQKHSEKAQNLFKAIVVSANYKNHNLRQRAEEAKKVFDRWRSGVQAPPKIAHTIGNLFSQKKDKSQKDSEPKLTTRGFTPKDFSISEPISDKKPDIRHIIIPIDIGALREKAYQAHLLDHETFKNLEDYNRVSLLGNTEQKTSVQPKPEKRLIVRPFPIYGQVSAGPNGESMLTPDHALGASSEVYNDMICNIEGKTHKIQFVPPFAGNFLSHKKYGWLKVKGHSMNKARPLSINPNDYILFCENHNIETCVNKIVIAQAPEIEGYPPRTMVKRLLSIFDTNLYKYKFWLHSESSLKNDPVTNASYEKDVEIENEYQIIGEVLAVASAMK